MFKLKLINKPKMIKLKCGFSFPNIVLANLQEKEVIPIKEVQEIVADKTYDGLSKVTVQSIPNEYIVPSGEIEFTQNGTYDVTDKASANVNVPKPKLGTKTITSNGTYKAIDDNLDGYSEVNIETAGVDINEYFKDTISTGNSSIGGWANSILKFRSPLTVDGTSASHMFTNYPLETIPEINTSNITNMEYMFSDCANITNIPQLNTSKVKTMYQMFTRCYKLSDIPSLNTDNVENMSQMFNYCRSLTKVKVNYNTSKVTTMYQMFAYCSGLQELDISNFDMSNTTTLQEMFYNSPNLEKLILPNLHTNKNERSARGMFSRLEKITSLDLTTLNNSYSTMYMFDNCKSLKTLSAINCDKNYQCMNTFNYTQGLENFGGMINLGKAYSITTSENNTDYTLDLHWCAKLTHESLMNVINNLYDIKTKGVKPQKLVLGTTNLAKLTEEERNIVVAKGWTLS